MRQLIHCLVIAIIFIGCYSPKRIAPIGIKKASYYGIYKVDKVVPGYVRIDIDIGIKQRCRFAYVYRMEEEIVKDVGLIKLIEYNDDKVFGEVINADTVSYIQQGDYVYLQYKSQAELNVGEYIQFLMDERHEKKGSRPNNRN